MDCHESQAMMSAYLDGELDASGAARHAAHLAACAACNSTYQELVSLRGTLKLNAPNYPAPSHVRHRIRTAVGGAEPARDKTGKLPWAWINFGIAIACSVAFALTLTLYLVAPSEAENVDQEIVASHYRSLLANHLTDVASSDHHTVKPWFSGKLDYSPPVADLAQQGFPLVGGRLDYINQRPVAALAYRHGQHLVNLFVWPDPSGHDTPAKMTTIKGFHLLQWVHSGMAYRAISDTSSQELTVFEELLLRVKAE